MERSRSPPDVESLGYVSWEEVKGDKGRREILYYLKRMDGGLDLAVIGKEKGSKHVSYRYGIRNSSPLFALLPSSRPKSRREVIDWLNTIVSGSQCFDSSHLAGSLNNSDHSLSGIAKLKNYQQKGLRGHTKEFIWLGSPWTCRKRRKHYQSFCRNGVEISVCDFIYVLAEEGKQLVAYLEDMYEDSKGSKMAVVRWFHKIDEVGIALPHKFIDREIFFSLCLQDLSVECIDGTATVLSPLHYEKFMENARHTMLSPFVCCNVFDNEEVKPFDITQVKGYWKQEILRYMCVSSLEMDLGNSQQLADDLKLEASGNDGIGPRKRHCPSKDVDKQNEMILVDMHNAQNSMGDGKGGKKTCSSGREDSAALYSKTVTKEILSDHLKVGVEVEVLSQDSGIRGCWFRAFVIKRHKNKVKVRYQDVKDADNESNNLEEWISATRTAVPDKMGIRLSGRAMIRPHHKSTKGLPSFDIGASVDVWWNDVWQEGIVVQIQSDDRYHVYFPGEKQDSVFSRAELRHSQEWLGNQWIQIEARPDMVTSLTDNNRAVETAQNDSKQTEKSKVGFSDRLSDSGSDLETVCDLSKDNTLAQLRWNSSKKRRRSGQKLRHRSNGCKGWKEVMGSSGCASLQLLTNLKVDHDNCKYMGDSLFGSAAQPLTSLVMSR